MARPQKTNATTQLNEQSRRHFQYVTCSVKERSGDPLVPLLG